MNNTNYQQPSPQPATSSYLARSAPTPPLFSPAHSVRSNASHDGSVYSASGANIPDDIQSLFITNASYFLKEHAVYVSHVEDCNRIYIRLEGDGFSVSQTKLHYRKSSNKVLLENFL